MNVLVTLLNKSSHVGLSGPPEGEGAPHEVGLVVRAFFYSYVHMGYIRMSSYVYIRMFPGARDAVDGHVFVAAVGGRRGPGPSP